MIFTIDFSNIDGNEHFELFGGYNGGELLFNRLKVLVFIDFLKEFVNFLPRYALALENYTAALTQLQRLLSTYKEKSDYYLLKNVKFSQDLKKKSDLCVRNCVIRLSFPLFSWFTS